jgi:hypothetical protein
MGPINPQGVLCVDDLALGGRYDGDAYKETEQRQSSDFPFAVDWWISAWQWSDDDRFTYPE